MAEDWGNGYADITTRANIQIREIAPKHIIKVLLKLQELGLTYLQRLRSRQCS
jgi:ferredoxin-nitrite reductase